MDHLIAISQGLLFIFGAPLAVGIIRALTARAQQRAGPSIWQPYFDLWKLFSKTSSNPKGASWVFRASPYIVFGCYGVLGFSFPIIGPSLLPSDLITIAYVLGLAVFFATAGGMAVGSPMSGLGSSRMMFLRVLVEPSFFLVILVLALKWHTTDALTMIARQAEMIPTWLSAPAPGAPSEIGAYFAMNGLLLGATAVISLIEAHRIPIDNLETNLELTMTLRGSLLEYSGPQLALAEWAESLKLLFFLTVMANLFFPLFIPTTTDASAALVALGLYLMKLLFLIVILVAWELMHTRTRLRSIMEWNMWAVFLALVALAFVVAGDYLMKG